MSGLIRWFWKQFFFSPSDIVVVGLENAGKTTLIKYLQENIFDPSRNPTTESEVHQTYISGDLTNLVDNPGDAEYRADWTQHYPNASVVLFVIDSTTPDRFSEVVEEFKRVRKHPDLLQVPIAILLNKCDLPTALEKDVILDIMEIKELDEGFQPIRAFQTSIANGQGVDAVFKWVSQKLS